MPPDVNLFLAGASGVGKTTLANAIAAQTGLPVEPSPTAAVLAACGLSQADVVGDPAARDRFQAALWEATVRRAREATRVGPCVIDRAADLLAYWSLEGLDRWRAAPDEGKFADVLRGDDAPRPAAVLLVRPHPDVLAAARADEAAAGRRAWYLRDQVPWRLDGAIQEWLEARRVPYVPVDCVALRDRVRLACGVLELIDRARRK